MQVCLTSNLGSGRLANKKGKLRALFECVMLCIHLLLILVGRFISKKGGENIENCRILPRRLCLIYALWMFAGYNGSTN